MTTIQHANEVTFTTQMWHSITHGYYIPKVFVPSWLTLVVAYYTYELVFVLNPITTYSKLDYNQLLNRLEQLHNLEQRPSHQSSSQ
jgi:hypothetical protein